MLKNITNIPLRFYQLALLNVGLIIAISKEMSLLSIISSLLFVGLAVAPFGIILGLLSPPPHQLIHDQILNKVKQCHSGLIGYLGQWSSLKAEQKQKTIIYILLGIYVSTNFVCPCIQTFLLVNLVFAYFFMQEEVEYLRKFICSMVEEKCPPAH